MPTDYQDYFLSRISQPVTPMGGNAKFEALQQASRDKIVQLSALKDSQLKQEQINAQSWAGKLGVEPDSATGEAVNLGASLYSGTFGLAGRLLAAPFSGIAAANQANLSEVDIAALGRHAKGQATPEDLKQINRKIAPIVPSGAGMEGEQAKAQAMADLNPNAPTPLSIWAEMNKSRDISRTIVESADRGAAVHQGVRDEFKQALLSGYTPAATQLEQGFTAAKSGDFAGGAGDMVSGVAKLLLTAGDAVVRNPKAVAEYAVENAPQLFLGAAGTPGKLAQLMDNISNAADTYNKGIKDYQAKNGGALPSEDQRKYMASMAVTHAMAEQLGDTVGLAATKLAGKAAVDVRVGFLKSLKNTAAAAGKGVLSEAPTEAYQTFAEGEITGKPATGAEIYTAGVIGGASGAALSGGGRALAEATGATPEQAAVRQVAQEKVATRIETQKAAIASGDVSALLDPKNAAYSPSNAITALAGHSALETTTPEQKQANLAKASQVIDALTEERDYAKEAVELNTPENFATWTKQLVNAQAKGNTSEIKMLKEALDDASPANVKIAQANLDKLNERLSEAHAAMADFNTELNAAPVDVAAHVATINAPVEATDTVGIEARTKAASALIVLSMAVPERLDPQVATALATNMANGLSTNQREYLRAFSAARLAENQLKDMRKVSQEIFTGSDKNVGIAQYRARMTAALAADNQVQADRQLKDLSNFEADHKAKAALILKAQAESVASGGNEVQVVRAKEKRWLINRGAKLSRKEMYAGGFFGVHRGTPQDQIDAFGIEASAITAALAELKAAHELKFSKTTQGGQSNVTNVSQAPATTQDSAPANQKVSAPASDAETVDAGSVASTGSTAVASGTTAVEGTGVTKPVTQRVFVGSRDPIKLRSGEAIYVSTNRDYAKQYSLLEPADAEGVDLGEFDVTLQNPLYVTDQGEIDMIKYDKTVLARLKAEGYDGVIYAGNKRKYHEQQTLVFDASKLTRVDKPGAAAQQESPEETSSEVEETAATTEESSVEAQSKDGTLEVMGRLTPEGTLYTQRNLIGEFFTQVLAKVGDKNSRPLVAMKDFLSTALTREGVKEFLGMTADQDLSDQQAGALKGFKKFAMSVFPKIQGNLSFKGDARHEYWYEDLMQFFITDTGGKIDIDENLKTAIAYAAFGYMAENVTRPENNTKEEINAILLRDENHMVSYDEQAKIGSIGTRQNVVINSLGGKVIQALGFKVAKDAPQDMVPRLTSALGAHVMKLLLDLEVVERSEMTAQELADLTGNEVSEKYAHVKQMFLKLARDGRELHPMTEAVFAANRGSGNVLDKLFGIEDGIKDPGLKPVPFIQRTIRNTMQLVPKALAKIMAHENSQPNYLRMEMWKVVELIGSERMLKIAGVKEVDTTKVHKINRASMEAKNAGLLRELENFRDYVEHEWPRAEDGIFSPIFLPHTVWKQQRVGISSTAVNPQTSKIHRHLLARPSWKTMIDPEDADQMENYKLRVAEGFGIKTDKMSKAAALLELEEKLQDPAIQAAVAVLRKIANNEDITEGEQDSIVEGVAKGKENMHSFDALVALAAESKDAPFEVTLTGEVDGVTNGPMLSNFLLGAANTAQELFGLLNRGGFFQLGSTHSNYNTWRSDKAAGNFDLYENTTGHVVQAIQGFITNGIIETKGELKGKMVMNATTVKKTTVAIYAFTGELVKSDVVQKAGRDIIKTPLTAMTFGSAVGKAVDSMADGFIESIYGAIEKTAAGAKGSMGREDLITHINTLLRMSNGKALSPNLTVEQLMEGDFDKNQTAALKKTFKEVIGRAVEQTMEKDFSTFMDRRGSLNATAKLAFTLHNSLYKAMRQKLIQELIEKDKAEPGTGIASKTLKSGQVVALHDLTVAQEQEVRARLVKVLPVMHTYFSKQDGNLSAGLSVSKGGRKLSQEDTYSQEVKFGTKTPDGKQAVNTHGYEQVEVDPGVAMVPMSTHSLDSAISHMAAMLGEVLNVHDAHAAGIGTFQQTAKNLNQATWKALLGYSPMTEMADTLSRTLQGMAVLVKQGTLPIEALAALKDELAKMNKGDGVNIRETLAGMRMAAYQADKIKLEAMVQMQSIDQYALEDGNYEVTDDDRDAATKLLSKLTSEVSKEDLQAIETIEAALDKAQVIEESTEQAEGTEITEPEETRAEKPGPFGALGNPAIQSDPVLVAFFEENPTATAKEVIQKLYGMLKDKPGRTSEFNALLLKKLLQVVNPELLFRFVTPSTQVTDLLAPSKEAARAWFVAKGFDEEINVLSPEFANSGLTMETLIHELTHGALARIVARELAAEKANPKYRSEALELIGELEELRDKAKAYAKKQGYTQFDAALDDIQEFIAYGMTNQEFQRAVLSQVSMPSRTAANELVNGLKMFIDKLVKILFKGSAKSQQEVAVNGLTVLISNVSGLMNEAENSGSDADLNLSMASPMAKVQSYTTLDIHNALNGGNLSSVWNAHLQDLLTGIVQTLHGPFGSFKAALMQDQAITPMDVWMKALNTGVAPFASKLKAAPILISEREMHAMEQVEAVMREALSRNETSAKTAYKELGKLFMEMREVIKPSDFGNQADYDFIFKISLDPQDRSDHLARFAAFGLAHQEFNNLMRRATELNTKKVASGKSFAERFQILFEKVLAFFHEKVTNTYAGEQADQKLVKLVEQLVDIEARKKAAIAKKSFDAVGILESNFKEVAEKGRTAITDLVNKPIVKDSTNAFVRAAGGIARTVANNQVEWVLKGIGQIRDNQLKGKHGFAMQMLTEVKGPGQVINNLVLAATNQQRHRKQVIDHTAKFSLQAFANTGKGFTKAAKAAVTQVFMRTGMHVLLDEYNMQELEQLVGNPQALSAAILATEKRLNGFPQYKEHFINQANALAAYRVTGRVHAKIMTMNAYAIARMYGFHAQSQFTEQQAKQVQPEIEKLIALYAIGYVDGKVLNEAKSTLRNENQRSDGNGVEFVLRMHKELDSQAHAKLFRGQEALMMHGYVPEIYNPNTSVVVANQTEGESLKLMGYVQSGEVSKDRADPDKEVKHLYVQRDGGLAPWVSGAMSTTGMHTKGSTKHSGFLNVNTADGLENASMQADIINDKSMKLNTGPRHDLSKEGQQTYMAPVLNPQGEIVNWRYMMQDKTKDTILERENDFTKVMGMLAGSIYDKESSKETNYKVLSVLYALDKAERKVEPDSYILVGPGSKDAQLREIWNLLPKNTREQAKAIWGKDGMWVRKDALTTIFGYRKFSLAESFRKDPDARNQVEKLFVGIMEFLLVTHYKVNNPGKPQQEAEDFAKRAAMYVTRGERGWQELVRATKDIIVVKSGVVMMGNVWSNIWLLKLSGVPLSTLVKTHLVALRGVRTYQADNEELARLQALVDTGLTGTKATQIEQEIARLKDALIRNPVTELIDAGLMPTISEDVEEEDPYSYKSSVVRATELITDQLHPKLVDVGKTLLVTHDTKLYQGLARITQLSDFVARYTLYEHLTNRQENPLSKEDAIFEASESFINYDIPMPKGMQYMDDMGITMFTKYFLRIQRVLGRMARDNPGQVLMTLALDNFLDLGPIVLESSWLHKVGNNPLNWGALQLPGSVGELGTVAGAMALVK